MIIRGEVKMSAVNKRYITAAGSDTVKAPQLTSLAVVKEPRATSMDEKNQGMHFNSGPGGKKSGDFRKFNKKHIKKSEQVRINSAFDSCEHMAELLRSSKWRDIQKALHWLDRVLVSKSNNLRLCRKKFERIKPKLSIISKKHFYSLKTNSNIKSYFKTKKFPDTLTNCKQNLINNLTPQNLEKSEKLEKECERKYKLGKNKPKHLYKKKPRRKNQKYFRKKITEKHRGYLSDGPVKPNNTVTESRDVFSESGKLYYGMNKNDIGNFGGGKLDNLKSGYENAVKIYNNLEQKLERLKDRTGERLENKGKKLSGRWPVSIELGKPDGRNYKKENPWPNFIYHRVSSDVFHLKTGSNHKQSAYVAISVNTSGEPEAIKKKNKIFGL